MLIAGDVYENVSPTADAQKLVVTTLLRLARAGIEVIAIAGNHDHGPTFEAYRPLMRQVGIRLIGSPRPADQGGVLTASGPAPPARRRCWPRCRSCPSATPSGPPR